MDISDVTKIPKEYFKDAISTNINGSGFGKYLKAELIINPVNTNRLQKFTKGASIEVAFKSGKKAIGIIKRCNSQFADVLINNKIYLVNYKYQVLS